MNAAKLILFGDILDRFKALTRAGLDLRRLLCALDRPALSRAFARGVRDRAVRDLSRLFHRLRVVRLREVLIPRAAPFEIDGQRGHLLALALAK